MDLGNGLLRYVKSAFVNQWHLLALGASVAIALISPITGALLPLIIAGELIFLSVVATNPRFQRAVDALDNAEASEKRREEANVKYKELYSELSIDARRGFEDLRSRCSKLDGTSHDLIVDSQVQGIDKLLWVYLRLLYTREMIDKFLRRIDDTAFRDVERRTREKLELVEKASDSTKDAMRHSLEDTLATLEVRKKNVEKAKENRVFIDMELDRISTKLLTLSEMALNRNNPEMISSEVEGATRSLESAEQTMSDLGRMAGFSTEAEAPELVRRRERERVRA
jgi:hypothetical protein